jgi:surfactin synthase thioesterase subunit
MNESGYRNMKTAIEEIADTVDPLLDKPFYIFGHSMGARISLELARFLRRYNLPQPERLFVSGSRGPHMPPRHKDIHALPDREFLAEINRLGGTPTEVLQHEELMQLFMPILRADFTLLETYRCAPEPPLACPINAYCGTEDREASEEEVAGWQIHTSNDFKLVMIPGNHFFINSQQDLLLQHISQEL